MDNIIFKNSEDRMQFHKPMQLNSKDSFGEKTKVIHGEDRREWQWGIPGDHMGFKLPIYISFCGNSLWDDGVGIIREKSLIFSIEMVTAGNIRFIQDKKEYLVNPGELFFLQKGSNHTYHTGSAGFAHKRFISILGDILETVLTNLGLQNIDVLHLHDPFTFIGFVKKAGVLFEQRPPDFLLRLSELAFSVVLYLGNELKGNRYPAAIQTAIDFLHHNVTRSITLNDVSTAACMSIPHLGRLFLKSTGKTPMEYYCDLKIEYARQLVTGTTARGNEIARRLGFDDAAYFSRLFKKHTGLSPREFRKKHTA